MKHVGSEGVLVERAKNRHLAIRMLRLLDISSELFIDVGSLISSWPRRGKRGH